MSEATPCNHCSYYRIKQAAKAKGATAKLVASNLMAGWTAAEVTSKDGTKKQVAHFMEVTTNCVC